MIASEEQVITFSVNGYIKRTSQTEYQEQRRGGLGKRAMKTRAEDSVRDIFFAHTHGDLLVFTTHGHVFRVAVHQLPEGSREARGTPLINLIELENDDEVATVLAIRDWASEVDLLFCSRKGLVKRTALAEYRNLRAQGLRAYDCAEGDSLFTVALSRPDQNALILTRGGMSIRFPGADVRQMGRVARGVKGVELAEGDEIAGMLVVDEGMEARLLTVTERGFGKRTSLSEYRLQGRGGKGVIDIDTGDRNGAVVGAVGVQDGDRVMVITDTGRVIKCGVDGVRETARGAKGVRLIRLVENERVVSLTRVLEAEVDGEEEMEEPPTALPGEGE
jgi:DNA gyrase subunit A